MATDAMLCKELTPIQDGNEKPTMGDIKKTLEEFKKLPEEDQDDLRKWADEACL